MDAYEKQDFYTPDGDVLCLCDGAESAARRIARALNREAALGEVREVLNRAIPWLGFLIAQGGHLNCAAPESAVETLAQCEAAIFATKDMG